MNYWSECVSICIPVIPLTMLQDCLVSVHKRNTTVWHWLLFLSRFYSIYQSRDLNKSTESLNTGTELFISVAPELWNCSLARVAWINDVWKAIRRLVRRRQTHTQCGFKSTHSTWHEKRSAFDFDCSAPLWFEFWYFLGTCWVSIYNAMETVHEVKCTAQPCETNGSSDESGSIHSILKQPRYQKQSGRGTAGGSSGLTDFCVTHV